MQPAISRHAQARMQARSIPPDAIELLLAFGTSARLRGADGFHFDQAGRRRAAAALDQATLRRVSRYLDTYAVVADDGVVVTAAWRTRRLRRA